MGGDEGSQQHPFCNNYDFYCSLAAGIFSQEALAGSSPWEGTRWHQSQRIRDLAAVSASPASPRTREVPSKTGKRAPGCAKPHLFIYFIFNFPNAAGSSHLCLTLSMQPTSIPRQGKGPWEEQKKSNHLDGILKLNCAAVILK